MRRHDVPRGTRRTAAALVVAALVAGTSGCNAVATTEVWAASAIGSPVDSLGVLAATPGSYAAEHGGLRREAGTASGGAWYRYPLRPSCDVLFEVDGQGVVRGWRPDGADC